MEGKTLGNDIVIYSILIDGFCNARKLIATREIFYSLPAIATQCSNLHHNAQRALQRGIDRRSK